MPLTLPRFTLLLLLLGQYAPAAFAEPATVITDSPLYQRPSVQSAVLRELAAGTRVETVARSGGWKQVTVNAGTSGWLRGYQVRAGEVPVSEDSAHSGGFLGGLASLSRRVSSLFSGPDKRQNTYSTATIGVRGLSEEQIRGAQADFAELVRMEKYRSSESLARSFAHEGGIRARRIGHLPPSAKER